MRDYFPLRRFVSFPSSPLKKPPLFRRFGPQRQRGITPRKPPSFLIETVQTFCTFICAPAGHGIRSFFSPLRRNGSVCLPSSRETVAWKIFSFFSFFSPHKKKPSPGPAPLRRNNLLRPFPWLQAIPFLGEIGGPLFFPPETPSPPLFFPKAVVLFFQAP